MEKILVLNSGSSSLKYQLFNVDGDKFEVVAKGLADRIGIEGSLVTIKVGDGDKVTTELPLPTHKEAIKEVLDLLLGSVLKSIDELSGVGHRVVHGGEYFDRSVLVDDEVIRIIDGLSTLAPLHNPAHIQGIRAAQKVFGAGYGHQSGQGAAAERSAGGCFRYRLPSDDEARSLYVCAAA